MTRSRRARALAVVLSLSMAAPLTVHSIASADVSAADKETARTLMNEGRKARDAGDHKAALEAFKKADAIMSVPTTKLEVGHEYESLGLLVEARDAYLAAVRAPVPPKGDPKPFAEARKEAEAKADALEPRIPSIKILVSGVPEGVASKVSVDGEEVPNETLDVPRKLDPGDHVVAVVAGGVEKKEPVTVAESETKDVAIQFAPGEVPTGGTGGSELFDKNPPKDETPQPTTTSSNHTLAYIGFGVGGAALIAGAVTGFMSMSKTSSLKDACPNNQCPASKHDDLQSAKSLATISTISFIVAGVGATVGVIDLLAHKGGSAPAGAEPAPAAARVQVYLGVGSAGIQGAF
jgi:hypothetical protein